MQKIAIFFFWVSLSLGTAGWLALSGLSADCYFSPPPAPASAMQCFATALTLSSLLFFAAASLATIAYLWLPWKKQRLAFFTVIAPCLLLLSQFH